tara:strand:- start:1217 stop:2374 length:1158 start_codon:yes stop_codon:yes gene_type:complete
MVKFAHIADIHLGGWKQQPLQDLNLRSFKIAVDNCISENVDFVLFAGDLFDSPYPSIDILKETFVEFKKLNEAKIPCFMIAGSHDYSVSGKTFLDVLEKTGFCKNVTDFEETEEEIILKPVICKDIAIYGFPGKKTGLEVKDLRKIKLQDSSLFKILMLHTTLDRVVGDLPIDYVDSSKLPKVDYYALGHIHVLYNKDKFVYPGPIFPNNFVELEDLHHGHFCIVDTSKENYLRRIKIKIKETELLTFEVKDTLTATEEIISELEKRDITDKIVLLRVKGELEKGKSSDIDFQKIEKFAKDKGAYFMLKNTHDLKTKELDLEFEIEKTENIEEETIKLYSEQNPSDFNNLIPQLVNSLSIEKQEGENSENFIKRILEESKKILKF